MKLLGMVLVMSLFSQSINAKTLKVGMPHIPERPNHLEIHSLYEYVIFDDLLRPLVKFDSNGEISADLVLKWEIKDDFKKFIFTLKDNQTFSDGTKIGPEAVVASLKHLSASPDIVHGDGKKIKKIAQLDQARFEIELFESDPFFLTELSSPEYRVCKNPAKDNYQVTSGPYVIENNSGNGDLTIKINSKYPFGKSVVYDQVHFEKYDIEKTITKEMLEKFDIIWPKSTIKNEEIEQIKKAGFNLYQMNLGFSYWFSLNPKHLNLEERTAIFNKLNDYWAGSSFFAENNLSRATQLFLPYGPGRMTETEINAVLVTRKPQVVKLQRELKVLLPKSIQKEIIKSVESMGFKIKIDYYENFNEYTKMINAQTYDILFVNNDLSSIDLRSSLIVTFNPSRQLVFIDEKDHEYNKLLKSIKTEQSAPLRYQGIKALGKKVLEDALVVPLYYKMGIVLTKKNIDLSDWNKAGAETFAWKIK